MIRSTTLICYFMFCLAGTSCSGTSFRAAPVPAPSQEQGADASGADASGASVPSAGSSQVQNENSNSGANGGVQNVLVAGSASADPSSSVAPINSDLSSQQATPSPTPLPVPKLFVAESVGQASGDICQGKVISGIDQFRYYDPRQRFFGCAGDYCNQGATLPPQCTGIGTDVSGVHGTVQPGANQFGGLDINCPQNQWLISVVPTWLGNSPDAQINVSSQTSYKCATIQVNGKDVTYGSAASVNLARTSAPPIQMMIGSYSPVYTQCPAGSLMTGVSYTLNGPRQVWDSAVFIPYFTSIRCQSLNMPQ